MLRPCIRRAPDIGRHLVLIKKTQTLSRSFAISARSMASNPASQAHPIILCGQTTRIGSGVIEGLKPDYEVVQFIMSVEACVAEIPHLIQGEASPTKSSDLGTGAISKERRPGAVVLGGGFADSFDRVREGVRQAMPGGKETGIAWLRHDGSKPAPPLGPEYGKAMVQRVRETLGKLVEEGKFGKEGVYWY